MKMADSLLEILNDLSENIESTEQSPYEITLMNKRKHLKALKKKRWYKNNIKAIDNSLFDIVLPQEDAQHPLEEPLIDDDFFSRLNKPSGESVSSYKDDVDFSDLICEAINERADSYSEASDLSDNSEVKERNKAVSVPTSASVVSSRKNPSLFECWIGYNKLDRKDIAML